MSDQSPAAERSRTPAAQTVALVILGFGSFEILTLIICLTVFKKLEEPALLLLSNLGTAIVTLLGTIATFYFGSSIGSARKDQTIASLAGPSKDQE
ncbi:MAG: hypothetical protein ACYDD1_11275 [Caulobacteraceae bacterium]